MQRRHRSKPQSDAHRRESDDRWPVLGVCIFLALITWFVFGQTLRHEFINYDDEVYVQKNPQINHGFTPSGVMWAFTHSHAANWHPVTSMSHMLDSQLFGLKAGAHHFTNVFLHTIAVILLFLVLRQMTAGPSSPPDESVRSADRTGTVWRSAFVAALFAVHPLHVESVAWVAERKDVLSGVFFMLTLGAYVRYVRNPSPVRYVTMSILFVLGLMSKPMLVTVPFVLLLLDYWPLQRNANFKKLILEKVPLFLLAAASCLATVLAQTGAVIAVEELPFRLRVGNAMTASATYIWQLFWPENLAIFYPIRFDQLFGQVALAGGLLLFITAGVLALRKQCPYLFTGWFWYLGMLVPVIGLLQVGSQAHADRYTYLPHIGLYLMITWGICDLTARWPYRRQILTVAAAIIVAALAWRARIQTAFWHDSEKLWRHALAVTTNNNVAHRTLAKFLFSQKRMGEAVSHLEEALTLRPNDPEGHNMAGTALVQTGQPAAAVDHWKTALALQPHDLNAEGNLAWVFATSPDASMRDGIRAVDLIQDAIQRSGAKNAITLRTLAAAYAEAGRFSEAVDAAQQALDLANAQGNSGYADALRKNIDDFRMNIPLRDPSLAHAQPRP
jgi:protein O-mannosyl-transferase